ncbi:MAG: glycosyltransferase family 2 protein [Candidatus Omnitrophica bacterium]|nr:glycosyltransferase family 2 protein [Candidatus Omnitrophota bacterium]
MELSIVVPCYNEAKNVPRVLDSFAQVLGGKDQMELILVDNGSQDETGRVIDGEIARGHYHFARKVTVTKNIGYGFGILSGLKAAEGQVLAWTHADLQTDPGDVLRAYEIYLEKSLIRPNILVKGHRRNRKLMEKIFSLGMQTLASLVLGTGLSEINAQPKLFGRSLYEKMQDAPYDFSLDLYVLYRAKKLGYEIVPIPVFFKNRLYGEAKGGGSFKTRMKLMKRTVSYIFKTKRGQAPRCQA